jgi:hypothetical protein
MPKWDAWLEGLAEVLGPLLLTVPPAFGSRRPRDLATQQAAASATKHDDPISTPTPSSMRPDSFIGGTSLPIFLLSISGVNRVGSAPIVCP